MVNMGRIHMELGKFFMISLNLIKSGDELMIEIGEIMKENFCAFDIIHEHHL